MKSKHLYIRHLEVTRNYYCGAISSILIIIKIFKWAKWIILHRSAITQLKKERTNLKINYNVSSQKLKLKQDKRILKDISNLYDQKAKLFLKHEQLKNYLEDINGKIYRFEKDHKERQKLKTSKSNDIDEKDISENMKQVLFKVSRNITKKLTIF